jgi:hypothetical protein
VAVDSGEPRAEAVDIERVRLLASSHASAA